MSAGWPVTVAAFEVDADATPPTWRAEFVRDEAAGNPLQVASRGYYVTRPMLLAARRAILDAARAALADAVRAQDPDRHFKGLPESSEVIAAYDAVSEAEKVVARMERKGRRA